MTKDEWAELKDYFETLEEAIQRTRVELKALRADTMRFKGSWAGPAFGYAKGDVVHHRGASWIAAEDGATAEPGSGSGWWSLTVG